MSVGSSSTCCINLNPPTRSACGLSLAFFGLGIVRIGLGIVRIVLGSAFRISGPGHVTCPGFGHGHFLRLCPGRG